LLASYTFFNSSKYKMSATDNTNNMHTDHTNTPSQQTQNQEQS
jgi:hypothetical protein